MNLETMITELNSPMAAVGYARSETPEPVIAGPGSASAACLDACRR